MKRLFAPCLLSCIALLPARAEENTLNNVYHSLNTLGKSVRNTFAEDSDARPSPTPRRHRKSTIRHASSQKKASDQSDSGGDSQTSKSRTSDEPSKAKSSSESKEERQSDGEEKGDANASSIPATNQGGGPDSTNKSEQTAPMATVKPEALREFSEQPAEVQALIRNSLALTEQNLTYKYGSADPAAGGMDCSGFIYYVLSNAGFKDVPRDSAGQYAWVRKNGNFRAVLSRSADTFELNELKPGDLLFWSGTYKVDRDIPISHVMIYLGKEKSSGKPIMVGATDGRSYDGIRRFGVSVFDFKMPSGKPNKDDPELTAKFEGYASIPGLREVDIASKNQNNRPPAIKNDADPPNVKAKPAKRTLEDGD